MKTRIITGAVGVAFCVAVLFFLPPLALNITVALLGCIAVWELLMGTRAVQDRFLLVWCWLFAAALPFLRLFTAPLPLTATVVFAIGVGVLAVVRHTMLRVDQAGFAFFTTVAVAFALSSIAYLRTAEHGLFYVLIALVVPWMSDTGAYFSGVLFGRHKLCPVISPKKTVEGLIGGVLFSIASVALTAWLYLHFAEPTATVRWVALIVTAAALAPLSVFGDLFASLIKRQAGVKDYGAIFPGHGGVMDRFDSVLPVAPLLFLLTQWTTLIG